MFKTQTCLTAGATHHPVGETQSHAGQGSTSGF